MSSPSPAAELTYRDAIRLAMRDCLEADPQVVLLGEDIAQAGGAFKLTEGLLEEFGHGRIMDTPISETGFVGAAIGLAVAGFRPIADLMFADFLAVAWDQVVNEAAKYRYLSAGQMGVPLVIRCTGGAGNRFGAQHSQTTESWYLGNPGLKVVVPATPQAAYSLLLSAVADPDPVIFLEHKALYNDRGLVDRSLEIPIGTAEILRAGSDVTLVASLAMVKRALKAADLVAAEGIAAEVIDIRTLLPLDTATVVASVSRTGRLVTVEEQSPSGGWGAHVIAAVAESALGSLKTKPIRVGLPEAPLPFSSVLEDAAIPSVDRIASACRVAVASNVVRV